MRWQWLVLLSGVLGLGSPVLGQGIPLPAAGSSSAVENFSTDGNGLRTEGDWLLPLRSSADRIDGVPDRGWVAVGLLEEQAVTLLDGASGDPLWQAAVGFAPSVVRVDEARQVVYASGPNAPGLVALDLLTGELIQAYGLPAGVLDIAVDAATGRVFASLPSAQSLAVMAAPLRVSGAQSDPSEQPQARNLPMPGPPLGAGL